MFRGISPAAAVDGAAYRIGVERAKKTTEVLKTSVV
jgi:hypothetical protein